jgi:hypothetical protein
LLSYFLNEFSLCFGPGWLGPRSSTYTPCITEMTGTPPCLACWLKWGLTNFFFCLGLASNSHPPDCFLSSSWNYRHESPCLAMYFLRTTLCTRNGSFGAKI